MISKLTPVWATNDSRQVPRQASSFRAGTITAEFLGVREPDPRVFKAIVEGMARNFDADLGGHDADAARQVQEAFGALIDGWLGSKDHR